MPRVEGIHIIDVDTHFTEPHDLWTARAPQKFAERVPQVRTVEGKKVWMVDGIAVGPAVAVSVIQPDLSKAMGIDWLGWPVEDVHQAAARLDEVRLAMMDREGIWAQIVYPNAIGFGGQQIGLVQDVELKNLIVTIYNDYMAERQAASGGRIFPMGALPYWDVDFAVKEIQRMAALGLKGVNTTSDPQDQGLPDLNARHWDPIWEACAALDLPVNFHIGASATALNFFGVNGWPSHSEEAKFAIGDSLMFMGNGRVLANLLLSGVLERHPRLKVVSVESGLGWIPFLLEALDYEVSETAPSVFDHLSMKPSDYFRRQIYGTFWFERRNLAQSIEQVGEDNVMFETDFPHPVCIYPNTAEDKLAGVAPAVQEKVLSLNAARVYNIDLPKQTLAKPQDLEVAG